ncbi:MAG: hypothetical protein P4L79_02855 [Legionella sp.]|uniref:hypothetical protein n=1 Tax=Legionella sp. TaxID=459 RepID=UPI00283FA1AD|nr:hypothetical protein [Legionella sp.]
MKDYYLMKALLFIVHKKPCHPERREGSPDSSTMPPAGVSSSQAPQDDVHGKARQGKAT